MCTGVSLDIGYIFALKLNFLFTMYAYIDGVIGELYGLQSGPVLTPFKLVHGISEIGIVSKEIFKNACCLL